MKKEKSKNKDIKPEYKIGTLLKVLLHYIKPYSGFLILTVLFCIIRIGAALYAPIVIGDAIDVIAGVNAVDFNALYKFILLLAACLTVEMIFQWLITVVSNKISFSVIRDVRIDAFSKLNRVPLKMIDSINHGDIMSRVVNDSELVSEGLVLGFTQVFTGILTIGGTISFMFVLNTFLAVLVVIFTPVSLILSWLIAKNSHNKIKIQASKRGEMAGYCEEMISNQRIVKAFCYEEKSKERFGIINNDLQKIGVPAMFSSSLTNPTSRLVNYIIYAVVAAAGAYIAVTSPVVFSISALVSFLFYANQYSKPFNEITSVVTELQTAFASLRRVKSLLDEEEEKPVDSSLAPLRFCDGTLEAQHVYFSYEKNRPLIEDFNIAVKKGQRVAIVGPTGCGKTTLINLLMRFYDPSSGKILMTGQNINEVSRSSVRSNYGMVLQESWLFEGTIKENIAYGKREATDGEIIEAAKKAYIHKFIMRQENGYDTIVAQDGGNISQGQKQLLTLARIMLTSPPMLILDEATSQIDTRTERRIQTSFSQMMQGRTSFIIAHRLSTIVDADIILVMNNGNIIESGTHNELLARGGFYSTLYNSQFASY